MPYVQQEEREELRPPLEALLSVIKSPLAMAGPGTLNYIFTRIAIAYLEKLSYQRINDVIGALEGCKMEMYRRLAAKYEDQKASTNGDVYPKT